MKCLVGTTMVVLVGLCSAASALTITDEASVQFSSDQEPVESIVLDSFDTTIGTLTQVKIELLHSGSVAIRADNDDEYNTASVWARMIRTWTLSGPDITGGGTKTILSSIVDLGIDDGDGATVDPTALDGVDFGLLSYTDLSAGTHWPVNLSLYETVGPGSVKLDVTPTLMTNDLQWVGQAPDEWQMEVQNPLLEVTARITYTYVPEPVTVTTLALGGLLLRRRRVA